MIKTKSWCILFIGHILINWIERNIRDFYDTANYRFQHGRKCFVGLFFFELYFNVGHNSNISTVGWNFKFHIIYFLFHLIKVYSNWNTYRANLFFIFATNKWPLIRNDKLQYKKDDCWNEESCLCLSGVFVYCVWV